MQINLLTIAISWYLVCLTILATLFITPTILTTSILFFLIVWIFFILNIIVFGLLFLNIEKTLKNLQNIAVAIAIVKSVEVSTQKKLLRKNQQKIKLDVTLNALKSFKIEVINKLLEIETKKNPDSPLIKFLLFLKEQNLQNEIKQ